MATTVTQLDIPYKALEWEVHLIAWESTDATEEVSTDLSKIYVAYFMPAFGANAGHADGKLGGLEIDETRGSDGAITPASGAITVNRFESDDATALGNQDVLLVLGGKS